MGLLVRPVSIFFIMGLAAIFVAGLVPLRWLAVTLYFLGLCHLAFAFIVRHEE